MRKLIPYIAMLLVFLALDAVWLSLTARVYRAQLGGLMLQRPRLPPAAIFYLLQTAGIQLLVLPRAASLAAALGFGAAFGVFTYATYSLTNLAVLSAWSTSLAAMDIAWGAALTAIVALAGHLAGKYFA